MESTKAHVKSKAVAVAVAWDVAWVKEIVCREIRNLGMRVAPVEQLIVSRDLRHSKSRLGRIPRFRGPHSCICGTRICLHRFASTMYRSPPTVP